MCVLGVPGSVSSWPSPLSLTLSETQSPPLKSAPVCDWGQRQGRFGRERSLAWGLCEVPPPALARAPS